jgi:general secretion pathway protein K
MKKRKMKFFKNSKQTFINDKIIQAETGGVALVLVLWVLVVLIAIVGEFSYSMRTELKITRNFKEEEEAYQLALAGIEQAKAEILSIENNSEIYINANGVLIFGKKEGEEGEDEEQEPERKGDLGRGSFEYTISDEDGKLNINTASAEQLRYILLDSGVDVTEVDTIVDSILDWRDSNDLHRLNGAEEEYYQSLSEPYSCKDGPFDSIEELLLVKGMTPEIFYGYKDEEGEEVYSGITQYLTVYGSNRININTAPRVVLEAVLGVDTANIILQQREDTPLKRPIGNSKILSSFFTIISTGTNSDGTIKRTVKAIIKRKEDGIETVFWNDNVIG